MVRDALVLFVLAACKDPTDACHERLDSQACAKVCGPRDAQACLIWSAYAKSAADRLEALRRGCKWGSAGSCTGLGKTTTDPNEQREAFHGACFATDSTIQHGSCGELAKRETDPLKENAALEKGCRDGDAPDCAALGVRDH